MYKKLSLSRTQVKSYLNNFVFYPKTLARSPLFSYLCMVKRSYKKWQKIRILKITIQPLIFKY